MRARAGLIGGRLEIEHPTGGGTRVTVAVPNPVAAGDMEAGAAGPDRSGEPISTATKSGRSSR